MKKHLMIAGIALLGLPALVHAQSATATGSARVETRSTGGEAALRATAAARLPEAPVRRVIAEGEAKGQSAAAIDRAAMRAHARLRVAREALGGEAGERRPSEAEIVAGAEAMAAGATRAELERIGEAAPPRRDLTASLNVLAELSRRGSVGADAAATIAARLGAGATDRTIGGLGAGLGTSLGAGPAVAAPAAALDAGLGVAATVGGVLR